MKNEQHYNHTQNAKEKLILEFIFSKDNSISHLTQIMFYKQLIGIFAFGIFYLYLQNDLIFIVILSFLLSIYFAIECGSQIGTIKRECVDHLTKLGIISNDLEQILINPKLRSEHISLIKLLINEYKFREIKSSI